MADPPSMYNFFSQSQPSAAIPTNHAAALSTTSPPRLFRCRHCPRQFNTYQALGGHQNGNRRERTAAPQNSPEAIQQQDHTLPLFPVYQLQQPHLIHTIYKAPVCADHHESGL